MPGSFWCALVFVAIAGIATISRFIFKDPIDRRLLTNVTIGAAIGVAVMTLTASVNVVGTKQVAVVTTFGQSSGTLKNGLHLTLPWQKVKTMDGTIQTDVHEGHGDKDTTPCTPARIAHQSTSCVSNTVRWQIKPDAAERLFKNYKNFDNVRTSLVTRKLNAAINEVFKDLDPLATDAQGNQTTPSLQTLADKVAELLRKEIGSDIDVRDITIPLVEFDPQTQERINALQGEVANTRIAEQKRVTAEQVAKANEILAASVSNDPNVLVAGCLDTLADMVKKGQPVPPGFTCWPGSQSALVVPATKP